MSARRTLAVVLLASTAIVMLCGPTLAPHDPHVQHADYPYAPPMRPHFRGADGAWRPPFVHPLHLTNRLARRYVEDRSRAIPAAAAWRGKRGALGTEPIFFLGTDALGRDVLSRLLLGARASVGIAAAATIVAILIGALVGLLAGSVRGALDEAAMRAAEMILVLPAVYVALALRAALPLVLDPPQVFVGVAAVLACVGWPSVARGVRAIAAVESSRDYVQAARACGASRTRIALRHVLPAAFGFIGTQAALLLPAFAIAEATLSFAGFGFAEPTPTWGTMLQDAANVRALSQHPWLLAPAVAIAAMSWAMHSIIDAMQPPGFGSGTSQPVRTVLGTLPRPRVLL